MASTLAIGQTSLGFWRHTSTHVVKNGKRSQKVISLGPDRNRALRKAHEIEYRWALEPTVDQHGKKVWSDEGLKALMQHLKALDEVLQPQPISPPPIATPYILPQAVEPAQPETPPVMLHYGFDLFALHVRETRVRKGDCRADWADDIATMFKSIKNHIPNRPINSIDGPALLAMRLKITGGPNGVDRPKGKIREWIDKKGHHRKQADTGKPIGVTTMKHWLGLLGQTFTWFARTDSKIGWLPDRADWRDEYLLLTENQIANLLTIEEKIAKKTVTPDGLPKKMWVLDELKIAYKVATPYQRMLILFGVMLGWTQIDIATFRRLHLLKRNGEMYIARERNKTGAECEYWVAPELAAMIEMYADKSDTSEGALVFRTPEGLPLVQKRNDYVKYHWANLSRRADKQVRHMPFMSLRKLAGQLVENLSGSEEIAQLILAHKSSSVARRHYIGLGNNINVGKTRFERLHDVQREVHKVLKPMIDGTVMSEHTATAA